MKRNLLLAFSLCFSACLMAQTEPVPADAAPSADMSDTLQQDATAAETPEARVQRECREWAVQDGVPEDELPTYINDCVEDRKVQE
jgi:hypothetical protein